MTLTATRLNSWFLLKIMLQNNKNNECRNALILCSAFMLLCSASAQTMQACADNSTQYIIGGQPVAENKALPQKDSKCFVSEIDGVVKLKTVKTLKIDKTIKLDRDINPVAIKVNLYDKKTVEDRNFILNAELRKAIIIKEDLSKKKSSGQAVDEQQLSRLDADIAALKNELSR
jgi:hypothetical protein